MKYGEIWGFLKMGIHFAMGFKTKMVDFGATTTF